MEPQLVLTGVGMNALRKQSTTVSGLQKQQESVHCLSSNPHDRICAIFRECTTDAVCYNVFATCLTVFFSLQRLWIYNPGSSCRWNHRESRTSGDILSEQASLPRIGQVLKLEFQHNSAHVCWKYTIPRHARPYYCISL